MVVDPTQFVSDLIKHEVAQDAVTNRLNRKGLEQKQPSGLVASPLGAETVQVKYRGPVDLGPLDWPLRLPHPTGFQPTDIERASR
jgi:hypothetical protein